MYIYICIYICIYIDEGMYKCIYKNTLYINAYIKILCAFIYKNTLCELTFFLCLIFFCVSTAPGFVRYINAYIKTLCAFEHGCSDNAQKC